MKKDAKNGHARKVFKIPYVLNTSKPRLDENAKGYG